MQQTCAQEFSQSHKHILTPSTHPHTHTWSKGMLACLYCRHAGSGQPSAWPHLHKHILTFLTHTRAPTHSHTHAHTHIPAARARSRGCTAGTQTGQPPASPHPPPHPQGSPSPACPAAGLPAAAAGLPAAGPALGLACLASSAAACPVAAWHARPCQLHQAGLHRGGGATKGAGGGGPRHPGQPVWCEEGIQGTLWSRATYEPKASCVVWRGDPGYLVVKGIL
eukprot:1143698-Pelagomonas_calceolata.AAC.4